MGLKLCILPHQIQVFLRKGALLPPGALYVGLDLTHGFLRFALDVSPSKQFLKVGSPGYDDDDDDDITSILFACIVPL